MCVYLESLPLIKDQQEIEQEFLEAHLIGNPISFLIIDMDGSLIKSDTLIESFIALIKFEPLKIFIAFRKFLISAQELKHFLAPYLLRSNWKLAIPYNNNVLDLIKSNKVLGKRIILATGACSSIAHEVYKNLGVFDDLIASNPTLNCIGPAKQREILNLIGESEFSYVGNSIHDVPIWLSCRKGYIVKTHYSFLKLPRDIQSRLTPIPYTNQPLFRILLRALRFHQWSKNALLFVPLFAAHKFYDSTLVLPGILSFLSFSLTCSGVYLLNDIFDIFDDRLHPTKRNRPIPAGDLAIPTALNLSLISIFFGLLTGFFVDFYFCLTIFIYICATGIYSLIVKKITLFDVFFLAGFYTLRVIAGGFALSIPISNWLLSFTLFFFLSLAFAKRFQELKGNLNKPLEHRTGRGYIPEDLQILAMLGCGSGVISVSIFALYLQSEQGFKIYHHLDFLWPLCILMFYWISRVWLLAYRGELPDDPVIFALKDKQSYFLAIIALGLIFASI
jgi:4-hydroxybenzoate polyprenyltransferase